MALPVDTYLRPGPDTEAIPMAPHELSVRQRMAFTILIVLAAIAWRSYADAQPAAALDGVFDGTANGRLFGWAVNSVAPSTSTQVAIYVDGPKGAGTLAGTIPTDHSRADVNTAAGTTGLHGFSWNIPAEYRKGTHFWYVYALGSAGDMKELSGSPRVYPEISASALSDPTPVYIYKTERCDPIDIPDHAARAYRDAAGRVNLMASHYVTRREIGVTLDTVVHDCTVVHNSHKDPIFDHFRYNEWLHAFYTLDGNTVYSTVHNEWYGQLVSQTCVKDMIGGWVSATTLAVSRDGGLTYSEPGNYLIRYPLTPWSNSFSCSPKRPTLYGDFGGTNIISKDGLYYKFFTYHSEPAVEPHQVGECLMRTNDLGDASSWAIWDGNTFVRSKTAPCAFIAKVAGAQSVTYNKVLKLYVVTLGQSHAFAFSLSEDLIHWSASTPIAGVDPSNAAYPSLLDPTDTSRNFENTGQTPYLYYTHMNGGLDRDLLRVQLRFLETPAPDPQ